MVRSLPACLDDGSLSVGDWQETSVSALLLFANAILVF